MHKIITKAACVGLAASVPASSTYAATLDVIISGGYQSEAVAFVDDEVIEEVVGQNEYAVSDTSDSFASLSGGLDDDDGDVSVSVSSSGSAEATSGELKLTTSHTVDASSVPDGFEEVFVSSNSSTDFRIFTGIRETFTISGTGTASFSAFVDGSLQGNSSFSALVGEVDEIGNPLNFDPEGDNNFFASTFLSEISFTDELITFNIEFTDAIDEELNIGWSSFADTRAFDTCSIFSDCSGIDSASVDASGTTNIFFSGTDGLTVRANTSGFLGQSSFQTYDPDATSPSPVPLPAGAVLMLTGVAGLGFMRRRRKS